MATSRGRIFDPYQKNPSSLFPGGTSLILIFFYDYDYDYDYDFDFDYDFDYDYEASFASSCIAVVCSCIRLHRVA